MPYNAETKRKRPSIGDLEKHRASSNFSKCGIRRFDLHADATRVKERKKVLRKHGFWLFINGQ